MNNRLRYLFKNIGILTISNFASKILVFLLVPLYTSVLSTNEYGIYDIIVSTVSLLFPILTCNISDAVMRFSMDNSYSHDDVTVIGLKHSCLGIIIAWFLIFVVKLMGAWPKIIGLEILTAAYFFFFTFNQFLIQTAKGFEKVFDMGIAGVLGTVIMIIANIIFLLVIKLGLQGFFVANIFAQAVPALYLARRLRIFKYFKDLFKKNNKLRKEMLFYSTPLIATTVGWWLNSTSDRYVAALICGIESNGLLSVSYKIPQIINTVQNIFIQAWQISAIKEYTSKDMTKFYGKAFEIVNVIMAGICSILIIFTKPLGHILYQREFYEAWQYVPFLLVSCVLNSASGFLGPILSARKDSKYMALSAVYGAVANIIMNIILIYKIGVQGATIATVISSFIIYVMRKKAVGSSIQISRYYITLITWALLCIQAFIEIYTSFLFMEIAIIIILIMINKNEIKLILKFIKKIIK